MLLFLFQEDRGHAKPSPLDGGIGSPAGSAQMRPPGTLVSLLRRSLSWPQQAGWAVCLLPGRLWGGVCGSFTAVGSHLSSSSHEYVSLFELLSLGCPLLCMMFEVLGQIYREPQLAPPAAAAAAFGPHAGEL